MQRARPDSAVDAAPTAKRARTELRDDPSAPESPWITTDVFDALTDALANDVPPELARVFALNKRTAARRGTVALGREFWDALRATHFGAAHPVTTVLSRALAAAERFPFATVVAGLRQHRARLGRDDTQWNIGINTIARHYRYTELDALEALEVPRAPETSPMFMDPKRAADVRGHALYALQHTFHWLQAVDLMVLRLREVVDIRRELAPDTPERSTSFQLVFRNPRRVVPLKVTTSDADLYEFAVRSIRDRWLPSRWQETWPDPKGIDLFSGAVRMVHVSARDAYRPRDWPWRDEDHSASVSASEEDSADGAEKPPYPVRNREGYPAIRGSDPFVLQRPFDMPEKGMFHIKRAPTPSQIELDPLNSEESDESVPQLFFVSQASLRATDATGPVKLQVDTYLERIKIGHRPSDATDDDMTWDLARIPDDAFDNLDGHMHASVLQFLREHSGLGDLVMLLVYDFINDLKEADFEAIHSALAGRAIEYAAVPVVQLVELRDFTMLLGDFVQTLRALMALIGDISAEDRAAHPELLRAAPAVATCALCAAAPSAFVDPDAQRGYCAVCAADA